MGTSVAVYGATGAVGSAFLVHLLNARLLKAGDRVVLVGRGTDASRTVLTATTVDLLDAFDEEEVEFQIADDVEDVRADIFIMCAGKTLSPEIKTRRGLAEVNAPIFEDTARGLGAASPSATVIVITNPVELGVAAFSRYFDRKKVIGMGAQQDSLRFARAIAARLGVRRSRVRASVFGEHGEAMVPAWSSVYVTDPDPDLLSALIDLRLEFEGPEDAPATRSAMADVGSLLKADRIVSAYELVEAASPQAKALVEPTITVTRLKSTPNATANATLAFVEALIKADERKLHGQVLLDGEFCGLNGICGAPIQLTVNGWRIASHEPLTSHEQHRIRLAKDATEYVFDFSTRGSVWPGRADGEPQVHEAVAEPSGKRRWADGRKPADTPASMVIFDFDGTLADTWPWLAEELVSSAGRLGFGPMTREQVEGLRRLDTPRMFETLGIPLQRLPMIAADLRRRAEAAAIGFRLFDRIPELIRTLHGRGATLAVVSSNAESVVRTTLGPDLAALFTIYGCDTDVFAKAAAFTSIVHQAGRRERDAVAVGDETRDLQAARSAGIRGIAVEWGYADADLLRSCAPGHTAASVDQLVSMIVGEERSQR